MRNPKTTISEAARAAFHDVTKSARNARFETLEPRQHLSVSDPSPTDNIDFHFNLATPTGTTAVRTASDATHPKIALPGGFTWYDTTWEKRLSSVPGSTLTPMGLDSYHIWPRNPDGTSNKHGDTSEAGTRAYARDVANWSNILCIDIEEWAMDLRSATSAQVDYNIARFVEVLNWIRDEVPTMQVAIYGYLSLSEEYASTEYLTYTASATANVSPWYYNAMSVYSDKYADWQAASDYLKRLAEHVDYVMPSIYTGNTHQPSWKNYATSLIYDSRRFGKPVIPFIWPRFHDSVPVIGHTYIGDEFWQMQLDTVRELADGVTIWQERGDPFNPNDSWVQMTLQRAALDAGGAGSGNGDIATFDPVLGAIPVLDPMNGGSNGEGPIHTGPGSTPAPLMASASSNDADDDEARRGPSLSVFAIDSYIA